MLTEIENALSRLFPAEVTCDGCDGDVPEGEVVVLDGLLYGAECGCAGRRAWETLEPLLCSAWTPAEIETGMREFREARHVLGALMARIDARMGRY